MRRTVIAGNWKMYKDHVGGARLAREIVDGVAGKAHSCEVVLIPSFTTLPAVADIVKGTGVKTGAQDLYFEPEGAFTGEISGGMLRALGCSYVLVGHSERRHIIGEGGELLSRKLRAALTAGLAPIYCVGETLQEREAGRAREIVVAQIQGVLHGLGAGEIAPVVVAYEPVWAIGTGRTATPDDAARMHGVIREHLGDMFGADVAETTAILYGGSVKPDNAADLLAEKEIDGALIGGASLSAPSFLEILFSTG